MPYQVTAPDGLTATAVVYVPGTQATAIRLKPGARITLKPGRLGHRAAQLGAHDTSGRQLKITTVDQLSRVPGRRPHASTRTRPAAFQVHALGGYTGPGAVTVQVYDGASLQDPHGTPPP